MFKTAKNAMSRKEKLIYLISRDFLPGPFFNFYGCEINYFAGAQTCVSIGRRHI